MDQTYTDTIAALSDLQSQPLSIIRLSEHITKPSNPTNNDNNPNARTSDASTSASEPNPTAQSLAADLSHYRDLFSKLRFSYLEQVTKEKFLRAIVGDPPLVVDHAENVELEKEIAEIKQILKTQKEGVARLVAELEAEGRELAGRYEGVEVKKELLGRLPEEIQGLEERLRILRGRNEGFLEAAGGVGMGMEGISKVMREKEREREEVEGMAKALEKEIPAKERELERLQGELKGLEREKEKAVEGAREAVRSRKVGGEVGDELEVRGRWLKGCEDGLRGLLGVGS